MRKNSIVLKDHAHITQMRWYIINDLIIYFDRTAFDRVKADNHSQQRSFATAGRSQQRKKFSGPDIYWQTVDNSILAKPLNDIIDSNRYTHKITAFLF